MRSDRQALLAAVVADPSADLPRMVLADHLDESGRPEDAAWAEFIRVQVELARLFAADAGQRCSGPGCPRCRAVGPLKRREGALWAQVADRLARELPGAGPAGRRHQLHGDGCLIGCRDLTAGPIYTVTRGFVGRVDCPWAWYQGGPCECGASDPLRMAEPDELVSFRPACPLCVGYGRRHGLAKEVVPFNPVTRVYLHGFEPRQLFPGHWGWLEGSHYRRETPGPGEVPGRWFRRWLTTNPRGTEYDLVTFRTEQAARDALALIAANEAREAARLPLINTAPEGLCPRT